MSKIPISLNNKEIGVFSLFRTLLDALILKKLPPLFPRTLPISMITLSVRDEIIRPFPKLFNLMEWLPIGARGGAFGEEGYGTMVYDPVF